MTWILNRRASIGDMDTQQTGYNYIDYMDTEQTDQIDDMDTEQMGQIDGLDR